MSGVDLPSAGEGGMGAAGASGQPQDEPQAGQQAGQQGVQQDGQQGDGAADDTGISILRSHDPSADGLPPS